MAGKDQMKEHEVFTENGGQAYTEYILIVVLVMVPIYWVFNTFINAVDFYFKLVSFFVQLPFP